MIALDALAAIEKRAEAAHEAPWHHDDVSLWGCVKFSPNGRVLATVERGVLSDDDTRATARFIAHARGDVSTLVPIARAAIALEQAERPVDQVVARYELRRVLREAGLLCTIEHVAPTSLSCACGRPW